MGEGDPALAAFAPWDEDGAPPRTADELVAGLEATWRMIRDCLDRWTPVMLADPFVRKRGDKRVTRTRQWIIWHVIEHDLHHGGERFLTLGSHGLPTPDRERCDSLTRTRTRLTPLQTPSPRRPRPRSPAAAHARWSRSTPRTAGS